MLFTRVNQSIHILCPLECVSDKWAAIRQFEKVRHALDVISRCRLNARAGKGNASGLHVLSFSGLEGTLFGGKGAGHLAHGE
jgi:hypothetical protein